MDKINVLIAIDEPNTAREVLYKSLGLFDKSKVAITLLNVQNSAVDVEYFYKKPEKFIMHESEKSQFTFFEHFLEEGEYNYKGFVYKKGDISKTIINMVKQEKFDLIVLGSHNKKPIEKFFIGSVSTKIAKYAKVPVLIVKPSIYIEDKISKVYNVLVAVDGSACSDLSIKESQKFLDKERCEVNLLNVVLPLHDVIPADAYIYTDISRIIDESKLVSKEILDSAKNEFTQNGFKVSRATIEVGHPANTILQKSKELNVDLVIMGSHGNTGVKDWLLGGVSSKVLNHSHTSLILVKE